MADDEQFSLCWNNFNSNLSAGFHESLCRGDLVDVTLAAEGQFVKAHRLVLSVCSPYFRKMFTQMPANQHAFVFLKDVSHSALKDLIQFMYCGEVNVKQDALPAFISTAEALQIKGLTDGDPAPSQSPAKPSTPAPQPTTVQQTLTSPRVKARTGTRSSYKIESIDDSGDDKASSQIVLQTTAPQTTQQTTTTLVQTTVHSQKRPAQRSISTPQTKRAKNTADPLEASEPTTTQITVQNVAESKSTTNEPEFIDLPIELPTKSEPDYSEDAQEVETAEQEATYVEDDSYGDMKYDESYFTENEEANASVSGAGAASTSAVVAKTFSDTSYADAGDQSATEAQEFQQFAEYSSTCRGRVQLIYGGQPFIYEKSLKLPNGTEKKYWRCNQWWNQKCRSRVYSIDDLVQPLNRFHTHQEIVKRKKRIRKSDKLVNKSEDDMMKLDGVDVSTSTETDTIYQPLSDAHMKYEEIVADVTDVTEIIVPGFPQK